MPVKCRPKTMITTPATIDRECLYRAAIWPISVEIAPSVTNTTLNPRMNPTELTITRRINCDWGDLSSSTPAPEINETYPGTSGKTQGDRNEMSPAMKAAIGSGRLDMLSFIVPAAWVSPESDAHGRISLQKSDRCLSSPHRDWRGLLTTRCFCSGAGGSSIWSDCVPVSPGS